MTRTEAIENLKRWKLEVDGEKEYAEYLEGWFYKDDEIAFDMAIEALSIDIVRCKDCKYGEPNGQYGCKCYHYQLYEAHEMSQNDFCSRGCLPEIMTPPTGETNEKEK